YGVPGFVASPKMVCGGVTPSLISTVRSKKNARWTGVCSLGGRQVADSTVRMSIGCGFAFRQAVEEERRRWFIPAVWARNEQVVKNLFGVPQTSWANKSGRNPLCQAFRQTYFPRGFISDRTVEKDQGFNSRTQIRGLTAEHRSGV